jgi:hypothetical protein
MKKNHRWNWIEGMISDSGLVINLLTLFFSSEFCPIQVLFRRIVFGSVVISSKSLLSYKAVLALLIPFQI